ncbi:MAG TPA: peptide ABC transporter substrate-binding protein [Actinomycetota bacterium]|nr:peptide ABC transporter substrate-binding protein [Actinomycetota bacterium]
MRYKRRGIRRAALYIGVISAMVLSVLPASAGSAAAQTNSRRIGNFDVAGRFLEEWSKQGGDRNSIYVNGLPITARRPEISLENGRTYETQWFERARYEAHPENARPYDVLLGRLGANKVEGRGSVDPATRRVRNPGDQPFVGVDRPGDLGPAKLWFPETRHTISGKILEYWQRYGGLAQFGLPLSEQFQEVSAADGKTYTVQYFERNRFELHPEKQAPYEVELGLLGVEQYRATPVAADQLPIAPPRGVTSSKTTFIDGSLQEPDTLFCNEAGTSVAARFCSAITFLDALVGGDDKENIFPLAAWYVPTIENGGSFFVGAGADRRLVTKFKLRPGIKWSDGRELTSHDSVFSYKLILDDPFSVAISLQQKVSTVDNPDKYTVVYNWMSLNEARAKYNDPQTDKVTFAFLKTFIDLGKPVTDLNYVFIGTVHPKHVLEKIPVDRIQESSENTKPTGYGPYIVQEWKQGDQLVLVENPNYNLTEKPLIKRIISKFNTDLNANINAFLTGQLDGIAWEAIVVPPEQTPQIRAAGGVVHVQSAASWEHLDFYFGYEPFKDHAVREAMIRGINRKQIVDVAFRGASQVMHGPVPPGVYHSLLNPDFAKNYPDLAAKYKLPTYEFDPAAANRLLDQAGWRAPCGNPAQCTREKGGVKLSFEYATTRNVTRQAIQNLVANDLKQIGIDAQLTNYPRGFFAPDGPRNTGQTKLAQFAYTQISTSNFDAWDETKMVSDELPGNPNFQLYRNPVVTRANQLFSSELDKARIAEQSAIAQVEMMRDVALIPLVERPIIEIYRNNMVNRKTPNNSFSTWWNITQFYFR